MTCIVRVVGRASGASSLHDGRYVVGWDPDTPFGTCAIATTTDTSKAKVFADVAEVHKEWAAISKIQPVRPDGKPNRPLAGLTIEIIKEPERD